MTQDPFSQTPLDDDNDLSEETAWAIIRRDEFRCVLCGKSHKDGATIYVRCIIPLEQGGQPTLENGITVCSDHLDWNIFTDGIPSNRNLFVRTLNMALQTENVLIAEFCRRVLAIYDEHQIGDTIRWTYE